MLDIILILIGIGLLTVGMAGAVFPVLPGPFFAWLALLLVQCTGYPHFSWLFLLAMAVVALIGSFLDDVLPHFGARRFGGSRRAVAGSIVGMIAGTIAGIFLGFFLAPIGLIAGTLLGAFLGEYSVSSHSGKACKVAVGVFAGFALAVVLRFAICLAFAILFIGKVFY
jgi:uncharacterized protein YqgC (DUF456 family)